MLAPARARCITRSMREIMWHNTMVTGINAAIEQEVISLSRRTIDDPDYQEAPDKVILFDFPGIVRVHFTRYEYIVHVGLWPETTDGSSIINGKKCKGVAGIMAHGFFETHHQPVLLASSLSNFMLTYSKDKVEDILKIKVNPHGYLVEEPISSRR